MPREWNNFHYNDIDISYNIQCLLFKPKKKFKKDSKSLLETVDRL